MQDKNIVAIPIGDWSDDGHGKVVWYHIVVPKKFTKEVLTEQYNKNKQLLGFGLKDFAAEYEDGTMSLEQYDALVDFGFSGEIVLDEDDDKVYLEIETFFEITMFMLSKGLENFEWYEIKPDFALFTSSREMDANIGYGLFW